MLWAKIALTVLMTLVFFGAGVFPIAAYFNNWGDIRNRYRGRNKDIPLNNACNGFGIIVLVILFTWVVWFRL